MTYPDLSEAIDTLKHLNQSHGDAKRDVLLGKWIERLEKTQKEMRHLERIESFTSALKEKKEDRT